MKALVAVRGERDLFYLGTAQGGIYRSRDGGRSWKGIASGSPYPGYAVSSLAVDPASPAVVYAGLTGVVRGSLLVRSGDSGESWEVVRRWDDRAGARAVAVELVQGRRVIAAGGDGGVELSFDDGASWRLSRPPMDPGAGISFLAFRPGTEGLLYAGSFRHPFVTADLGRTWRRIAGGMVEDTEVFDIDFSPEDPLDFWAATCGWVYRTSDAGERWVRHKEGLTDRRTHAVRRDPRLPSRILAGTTGGLFESLDSGGTFHRIGPEAVVNVLAFDPADPSVLLVGTEADGVLRSEDGGRTFAPANGGLSETRVSAVVRAGPRTAVVARAADGPSGGIWTVDLESGESARLPFSPPATTFALASWKGKLFAGTAEGLFVASGLSEPFRRLFPQAVRNLLATSDRLLAGTSDGVEASRDGRTGWTRLGSLGGRIDGLSRVRLAGGAFAVAARSGGRTWYNAGGDWIAEPGSLGADGSRLLGGGFGKRGVAQSVAVAPQPIGLEVDEARGILVYRPEGGRGEAFVLRLPENGLSVADWAGDPRSEDGLLLATIGRGLFQYRLSREAGPAAGPTAPAPRRTSPSSRR